MFFQIVDEAADFLIDPVNHGSEGAHAVDLVCLLPGNKVVPRTHVVRTGARLKVRRQESKLLLFCDPGIADVVPALSVAPFVFGVVLG